MAWKYKYKPKGIRFSRMLLLLALAAIVIFSGFYVFYISPTASCVCPDAYIKEGDTCTPKCYYSVPKCLIPSFSCSSQQLTTSTTATTTTAAEQTTTAQTTTPIANTGTLIVALKDEDHKIPGGTVVKSLNFTITAIDIHANRTAENETSEQWVQLLDGQKTLDLLKYTTTFAKVAEKEIDTGQYDKIRLKLSNGSIAITNALLYIYNPRVYNLILPNETASVNTLNMLSGETLTLILDFDIENSVTHTADGYVMNPIIKFSEQAGIATDLEEI